MNQGKWEVIKQDMAKLNIDILEISDLKWTRIDEFNSGDHYIYYCGKESFRPYADWCGVRSGRKYNKFVETGLTPVRATMVNAPMIEESPVNLECKVTQVIPLGSHDLFLAEVVAVHVNEKLFSPKTDAIDLKRANLVAYSHGHYYTLGEIIGKFGFSVEKKRSQN